MYAPTVADILEPYKQYPSIIQQAILLVETNPRLLGLTRAMKMVLKTLLTRACKTNGTAPIRARLETVAAQAGVSTKSVQRTIAVLREAGWLKQITDGRTEYGVYTSRQYQFSEELCQIVELPIRGVPAKETSLSDGPIYVDLSFKKDQREISKKTRTEPIQLPPALEAIVVLGVKDTGVCKLRGMASARGYRLEDVFAVARLRLIEMQASGARVYRYLAAMIENPKVSDYKGRASQIERNTDDASAVSKTKERRLLYAYKRYAAGPGTVVRIFDGAAEVVRDGEAIGSLGGVQMEAVYDDIEKGVLREVLE